MSILSSGSVSIKFLWWEKFGRILIMRDREEVTRFLREEYGGVIIDRVG